MIAFLLAQTIAIAGGTVYPASGPKLANATVLIRDGRIAHKVDRRLAGLEALSGMSRDDSHL